MASSNTTGYKATIGIECHVQLKTKTKLFAAVGNDASGADPNTLVSHICLGMPGALPYLNEKAVEYACKMAFALHTEPQRNSYFERKHYFYPDLPKGYQISQLQAPIVKGGYVEITSDEGQLKKVRINRVQIEEDAGKNIHPEGKDYSLVDLNRAGTPLLEIVSEADIASPAEAKAYVRELYLMVRYLDISDADLFQGNMRFDLNVSVSNTDALGTRTETKNLNSFKSVEKAAEYEIKRQTELLQKGEKIVQETRGWDDAKQKTTSQRGKEEAHDYRYMPEPDVPPVELDDEYITTIKKAHKAMPVDWRNNLAKVGADRDSIETLLDAEADYNQLGFLELVEQNIEDKEKAIFLINWNVNNFVPLLRDESSKLGNVDYKTIETTLYDLIKAQKLSSTNAKTLFVDLVREEKLPSDIEKYAQEKGYIQVSDEATIEKIVASVLAANEQASQDVKDGEMKAIGFLVGQVMKESKGKANPSMAQDLIKKQLGV